jgi:hypothetical protein
MTTATAIVEITGGELRIGKELNRYQEILKGWYYSCFVLGTLVFAGFYAKLWSLLMTISKGPPVEEEPPCDLDDMEFEEAWEDAADNNFAEFEDAWENTANFEDWGGPSVAASQQQRGDDEPVDEEVHEDEPPPTPSAEVPSFSSHRPRRRETSRRIRQQPRHPRHETSTRRSRYAESGDSQGSWEDL